MDHGVGGLNEIQTGRTESVDWDSLKGNSSIGSGFFLGFGIITTFAFFRFWESSCNKGSGCIFGFKVRQRSAIDERFWLQGR